MIDGVPIKPHDTMYEIPKLRARCGTTGHRAGFHPVLGLAHSCLFSGHWDASLFACYVNEHLTVGIFHTEVQAKNGKSSNLFS